MRIANRDQHELHLNSAEFVYHTEIGSDQRLTFTVFQNIRGRSLSPYYWSSPRYTPKGDRCTAFSDITSPCPVVLRSALTCPALIPCSDR